MYHLGIKRVVVELELTGELLVILPVQVDGILVGTEPVICWG